MKRIQRITKELINLRDKGYVFCGVTEVDSIKEGYLSLVLIHRDWKEYSFYSQFKQAQDDVMFMDFYGDYLIDFEIPTVNMFRNERSESAPYVYEIFNLISD